MPGVWWINSKIKMKIISYKLKRELIKQKALGTAENKNIYI